MPIIKTETVRTASFSMEYFKFGHGSQTLVILPGLSVQSVMGSADAVAEAYKSLTEDFTVYLFDRRKELPEQYSVHDMARDTAEAIHSLGLEDIAILGASQGGVIAMYIAADEPELVKKLVLASTTAFVTEEQTGIFANWTELAKAGDCEGLYLSFGEAIYPEEIFKQFKGLLVDAAATVTDAELERFVILAEAMRGLDMTAELKKIICPALVIGSYDDKVLGGGSSRIISEHLNAPGSELYMYDGFGHAVYDTAPDFKERILYFLKN